MKVLGKINIAKSSLNLKLMLEGGQCFRWSKKADNKWIGVASNILWEIIQNDDNIEYLARSNKKISSTFCQQFLKKYMRLEEDLDSLYSEWSKADERFASLAVESPGLRMLDQEPIENIFSFICSSNNNITRISSMVEKMCGLYGEKVFEENGTSYFAFPSLDSLASDGVEEALRTAGFGYRAKFIPKSAKRLLELGGEKWLSELTRQSYAEAKQSLMQLDGVGPKVADCICLMSLGHLSSVPVDTHVFQLAGKYYLPHLRSAKSCTPKLYEDIHKHFLQLFGPYAGWAHTVLFCAELKMFQKEAKLNGELSKKSTKQTKKRGCGASTNDDRNGFESSLSVGSKTSKRFKTTSLSSDVKLNASHSCSGNISVRKEDLNLQITLNSGQSYRWSKLGEDKWRGIFGQRLWKLHQFDDHIEFEVHWTPGKVKSCENEVLNCQLMLEDYFRLDFPLQDYYLKWSNADEHFARISKDFYGLRMIKQDPLENTMAFICSSNNTITRMRSMVEYLCTEYGEIICSEGNTSFYDFPTINALAAQTNLEEKLVAAHFGFRWLTASV